MGLVIIPNISCAIYHEIPNYLSQFLPVCNVATIQRYRYTNIAFEIKGSGDTYVES